jgi:hypothetical protein
MLLMPGKSDQEGSRDNQDNTVNLGLGWLDYIMDVFFQQLCLFLGTGFA